MWHGLQTMRPFRSDDMGLSIRANLCVESNNRIKQFAASLERLEKAKMPAEKWKGSVEVTINAPIEKVWMLTGDFCGLDKWVNTLSCEKAYGEYQTPGCVRHVEGRKRSPRSNESQSWADERLLELDNESHSMKYEVADNSFGFKGFVSTFVLEESIDGTTLARWSFETNPIEILTEDDLREIVLGLYLKYLTEFPC